jgi:hypothetical protein
MRTGSVRCALVVIRFAVAAVLVGSGAALAQVPDFLQVGSRLTWQGGNSTLSGSRVVPDPEGPLERDGQRYRLEGTRGGGGVGLVQLNVIQSSPQAIVADVRYLLAGGPQLNVYTSSGFDVVVGDGRGLGEYWLPPADLAAMQPGINGNTRVSRGTAQFGGQTLQVVSIATTGAGTYFSSTYDVASGLMLFSGTMNTQAGAQVADDRGVRTDFAGAVVYSHQAFVGVRQVAVPWGSEALPQSLAPGRGLSYQGQNSLQNDPSLGLPALPGQPVAATFLFDRYVGGALVGRQVTQSYTTQGLPPLDATSNRAFGSAQFDGLWVSPRVLGQLQPQQMLDQDPVSGQIVYFGGVTGAYGVIIVQGQADYLEQYYDLQSGLLAFSRYRVDAQGVGAQVTELQLVGLQ